MSDLSDLGYLERTQLGVAESLGTSPAMTEKKQVARMSEARCGAFASTRVSLALTRASFDLG